MASQDTTANVIKVQMLVSSIHTSNCQNRKEFEHKRKLGWTPDTSLKQSHRQMKELTQKTTWLDTQHKFKTSHRHTKGLEHKRQLVWTLNTSLKQEKPSHQHSKMSYKFPASFCLRKFLQPLAVEVTHMSHIASNSSSLRVGKMFCMLVFSCSNLLGSRAVVSPLPVMLD